MGKKMLKKAENIGKQAREYERSSLIVMEAGEVSDLMNRLVKLEKRALKKAAKKAARKDPDTISVGDTVEIGMNVYIFGENLSGTEGVVTYVGDPEDMTYIYTVRLANGATRRFAPAEIKKVA